MGDAGCYPFYRAALAESIPEKYKKMPRQCPCIAQIGISDSQDFYSGTQMYVADTQENVAGTQIYVSGYQENLAGTQMYVSGYQGMVSDRQV